MQFVVCQWLVVDVIHRRHFRSRCNIQQLEAPLPFLAVLYCVPELVPFLHWGGVCLNGKTIPPILKHSQSQRVVRDFTTWKASH